MFLIVLLASVSCGYVNEIAFICITLQGNAPPLLPDSTMLRSWSADNKTVALYPDGHLCCLRDREGVLRKCRLEIGDFKQTYVVLRYPWYLSSRRS